MFFNRLKRFYKFSNITCRQTNAAARKVLTVCVLFLVILAFWKNSEYQLKKIQHTNIIQLDIHNAVSDEHLAKLEEYAKSFKKTYGLVFALHVFDKPFPPILPNRFTPEATVYLAIAPVSCQVYLYIPPLAKKVVRAEVINDLQNVHFTPYFAEGNWLAGVVAALNKLTAEFDAAVYN